MATIQQFVFLHNGDLLALTLTCVSLDLQLQRKTKDG